MVSRPPAVRRKPKASNEAPTYKSVMVALAQGIFLINKPQYLKSYYPENFTNCVIAFNTRRLPL